MCIKLSARIGIAKAWRLKVYYVGLFVVHWILNGERANKHRLLFYALRIKNRKAESKLPIFSELYRLCQEAFWAFIRWLKAEKSFRWITWWPALHKSVKLSDIIHWFGKWSIFYLKRLTYFYPYQGIYCFAIAL